MHGSIVWVRLFYTLKSTTTGIVRLFYTSISSGSDLIAYNTAPRLCFLSGPGPSQRCVLQVIALCADISSDLDILLGTYLCSFYCIPVGFELLFVAVGMFFEPRGFTAVPAMKGQDE